MAGAQMPGALAHIEENIDRVPHLIAIERIVHKANLISIEYWTASWATVEES